MVSQSQKPEQKPEATEIFYPDDDGQPMASNTEQYRWIVMIQQNLNWLLPDAFAKVAEQKARRFAAKLKELGIDPDQIEL